MSEPRAKLVEAIDVVLDEYGRFRVWQDEPHPGFVTAVQACLPLARLLGYEDEVVVLERFLRGAAPLARAITALQQARRLAADPPVYLPPIVLRPRIRRPPVAWRRFVRSR